MISKKSCRMSGIKTEPLNYCTLHLSHRLAFAKALQPTLGARAFEL